jgi:hypothetical protein
MCKDDQEREPEAEGGLMLEQKPAERRSGRRETVQVRSRVDEDEDEDEDGRERQSGRAVV